MSRSERRNTALKERLFRPTGFKLKTKDGMDYVGTLPFAEFAGLARAMRAHKLVAMR